MTARDGSGVYICPFVVFRLLPVSHSCTGEAVSLLDLIVGVIGVLLIIYLLATVLRPEKF